MQQHRNVRPDSDVTEIKSGLPVVGEQDVSDYRTHADAKAAQYIGENNNMKTESDLVASGEPIKM